MITSERIELIGALAGAAVCIGIIGWMIWNLLRPSNVPERLDARETITDGPGFISPVAHTVDVPPIVTLTDRVPRPRPIMANFVSGAFAFPTRTEFYDQERDRGIR